jgi:hypothetical protein
MMGCKNRVSCRQLFRRLEILPFVSQYILSLMLFVAKNKNYFTSNSENYTKCTRQFNHFYQPIKNFTTHQRGVRYTGIKIFNNLPPYIKDTSTNVTKFEICLKQFLHIHCFWYFYQIPKYQIHSFYTLEEYFQHGFITNRKWLSLSLIKNSTRFNLVSFLSASCRLYHCRSCSVSVCNLSPYLLITHVVTQQFVLTLPHITHVLNRSKWTFGFH